MHHRIAALICIALVTTAAPAFACDVAESHQLKVEASDAPACLKIRNSYSYEAGELTIVNECDAAAEIMALTCEGCGDDVTVEPGATGFFVVESRLLNDGETSSQTIAWTVNEDEGTVSTEVTYYDTTDACKGWTDRGGTCSTAPNALFDPSLFVMGFFGIALARRTRRRK